MGTAPDHLDPQLGYSTQSEEATWLSYLGLYTYAFDDLAQGSGPLGWSAMRASDSDFAHSIERAIKLNWGGESLYEDGQPLELTAAKRRPVRDQERRSRSIVSVVLNPHWESGSIPGVPVGTVNINVKVVSNTQSEAEQILDGSADAFDWGDPIPPALLSEIAAKAPGRYAKMPTESNLFFFLNTQRRPFSNQLAREAVVTALDRRALARLDSGNLGIGCFVLPRGMIGHPTGACRYDDPTAAPEIATAKALVRQSGMEGAPVTVWAQARSPRKDCVGSYTGLLNGIGFKATSKIVGDGTYFPTIGNLKVNPLTVFADWLQDFPKPDRLLPTARRPLGPAAEQLELQPGQGPAHPQRARRAGFRPRSSRRPKTAGRRSIGTWRARLALRCSDTSRRPSSSGPAWTSRRPSSARCTATTGQAGSWREPCSQWRRACSRRSWRSASWPQPPARSQVGDLVSDRRCSSRELAVSCAAAESVRFVAQDITYASRRELRACGARCRSSCKTGRGPAAAVRCVPTRAADRTPGPDQRGNRPWRLKARGLPPLRIEHQGRMMSTTQTKAPARWRDDAVGARAMLSRTDGRLTIDGVAVDEIVARFGSPLYLISERTLRARAREAQAAFAVAWPEGDVLLLPSIKANAVVALQRVLAQEGCGCDLFGGAELEIAVRAGIDPQRISVNGTAKDRATIERAVAIGARITIDNVREIELAQAAARAAGRRAQLSIRLRPELEVDAVSDGNAALAGTGAAVLIRDAYARYKPGVPFDDLDAAGHALDAPELDVVGAMMHFPRHTTDLDVIGHVAGRFAAAIAELSERWDGWRPRSLDVGGGFAPADDPFGRANPALADRPAEPGIDAYAASICTALRAGLIDGGIDPAGIQLEAEPGRWLFGPTGIHVTSVLNVKRQSRPFAHAWVETDTTQHFLSGITSEWCRFPVTVGSMADEPRELMTADVVGRSCKADVLAPGERLPLVEPGDLLAFCATGAYQEMGACSYNAMPRPGTVLVSHGEAHLVRRAETIDDVLGRDVNPPHLSRGGAA